MSLRSRRNLSEVAAQAPPLSRSAARRGAAGRASRRCRRATFGLLADEPGDVQVRRAAGEHDSHMVAVSVISDCRQSRLGRSLHERNRNQRRSTTVRQRISSRLRGCRSGAPPAASRPVLSSSCDRAHRAHRVADARALPPNLQLQHHSVCAPVAAGTRRDLTRGLRRHGARPGWYSTQTQHAPPW